MYGFNLLLLVMASALSGFLAWVPGGLRVSAYFTAFGVALGVLGAMAGIWFAVQRYRINRMHRLLVEPETESTRPRQA